MKRFILLSLMGLLIMALSSSAYAQIEFKASGFIDAQWEYNVNASSNNTSAGIYKFYHQLFYPHQWDSNVPIAAITRRSTGQEGELL